MKQLLSIFLFIILLQGSKAQINTNLIVSGTPPATLTEWALRKDALLYQVQRGQGVLFNYKIKTEIKLLDGTVIARNDLAKAATYQLGSANVIYYAPEVLQLELMQFTGKYKTTFDRTGKLMSDNYQLCTRLVNPIDYGPLSNETCKSFYIASLQLPILMKPSNDETLEYDKAKTAIIFRWSPVVPMQATPVNYRLMVFEVLQNQNPVQAMRSNMPLLTKDVKGTTQYIWQPQGMLNDCPTCGDMDGDGYERIKGDSTKKPTKEHIGHVTIIRQRTAKPTITDSTNSGSSTQTIVTNESNIPQDGSKIVSKEKKFVWTIQALDAAGKPLGDGNVNGDGISEPVVFSVRGKVKDIKHDPGIMRKVNNN